MLATKLHAVADPDGSGEWSIGLTREPIHERFDMRDSISDGGPCVVHIGEQPVAECTAHHVTIVQMWSNGEGDHDHYGALRLVAVLDSERWCVTTWRRRSPGDLFVAWNHGLERMDRDEPGGPSFVLASWDDVERAIDEGRRELSFFDSKSRTFPS